MTQTQTSYTLPLSEAQKQEIFRAAHRARSQAFAAAFRAIGQGVRALFASKPAIGGRTAQA